MEKDFTTAGLVPIIGSRNVIIEATGEARGPAIRAIQSVVLRLLATVPPPNLRLLLIDPIGLGQNVAGFMHLADFFEELVAGKAWSEVRHIEEQLLAVTTHMEVVIQKYLRLGYATMEDYNAQAAVPEAYRLVVAIDFPVNFSEEAARRLVSIARNGPRCGVFTLVAVDRAKEPPHYRFNLAELAEGATMIAYEDGRFFAQDEDYRDLELELDAPPPPRRFELIVKGVGFVAKKNSKVSFDFKRIAVPQERWWRATTTDRLTTPIGVAGGNTAMEFLLGEGTAHHVLIAGRTGSGKSSLMHALIVNLALAYSPDELELYLIDFKQGVEFKDYAAYKLPHVRVVAIESEREFGLSVLQGLDREMEHRAELFREVGAQNVAAYRAKRPQGRIPRILLIVDEFQEFFVEGDAAASQASLIIDRLVRQGRSFGVHVLMASQTLGGAYSVAKSTMDQMYVRIALQCSEADSRLILSDDNPGARFLSRPGEAIYNSAGGQPGKGNEALFQAAWLSEEERREYLRALRLLAEREGRPSTPIVFEGGQPALLKDNINLRSALSMTSPTVPRLPVAWLGEPVAIQPPTAARFWRQSGKNLLIVGRDERTALGMLTATVLSLAAQYPTEAARFLILDVTSAEMEGPALFTTLADTIPHEIRIVRSRGLGDLIGETKEIVERRVQDGTEATPAIYLLIAGLHRARDLKQEDEYSFGREEVSPASPSRSFQTVLREGPDTGVHVIAWCDSNANLMRILDRRTISEFGIRVAQNMSQEDSTSFLGEPMAARLGPHRALLHDEEQVGRFEKFRPYSVPDCEWIREVRRFLERRQGGGEPPRGDS